MKNLLLLALIVSGSALANTVAPPMRGEYLNLTLPAAINLAQQPVAGLPMPKVGVSAVVRMPTVLIPQTQQGGGQIDVTLVDDFIDDVSPNARHYPTNFPNRTALHYTRENVKHLSTFFEPFAQAKNASYEVLIRAAKLNAMGRNLDLGPDYGVRASTYLAKALQQKPNDAEANLLYGIMLAEGGGFKESKKYLTKAAATGSIEAEQSLAQAELLGDNKAGALARLKKLQSAHPNNAQISQQLAIVQGGGYYIWDIKDDNISVKPIIR